jgi:hypothetical protein
VQLQVLDSFFSTIPGFKSDIDPISARTQSVKSADDSSVGLGAGSSRTLVVKLKAITTPPRKKKPQKEVNKRASRIKINDLAPNPYPTPTPSKSTRGWFFVR